MELRSFPPVIYSRHPLDALLPLGADRFVAFEVHDEALHPEALRRTGLPALVLARWPQ